MSTRRPSLLGLLFGAATAAALVFGCSTDDEPKEPIRQSLQTALLSCPTPQFGGACDPDGSGTLFTECQGMCVSSTDSPSGQIVCRPISELGLQNLAGYLC